ncbi:EAL domain-containing protein [Paraburkholderia fungorum]|jgi:c-di-GMP phosphodiesterase|uniref:cyclic-guanylate-specific phosphodiesterase n=1 Tax=Paraburkholderia fungorum TaxID=134537 RepID=A0AAP5UYY0_9BURK|nr:EAL domain-containing protein [Paraburkholderia fungorum]MDT8843913.1 EAL domain-containing protein [Paraburkholderia fungorum]
MNTEVGPGRPLRLWGTLITAAVMTLSLAYGYLWSKRAVMQHERAIARDLVVSIDTILNTVTASRNAFTTLVGRPCSIVQMELTARTSVVPYVRELDLVQNGRQYCSSASGEIDLPLTHDFSFPAALQTIGLLPGDQSKAGATVLTVFYPVGEGSGVRYVLEGIHFADALRSGMRMGASTARLSIANAGVITEHGQFGGPETDELSHRTSISSADWPVTVSIVDGPAVVSQIYWKYLGASVIIGATIATLLLALVREAFSSRRRILKDVKEGLRNNRFYLLYQPIVDLQTGRWVGVEALIRWDHRHYGTVSPAAYLGEVESSDVIGPLTSFVLRRALCEIGQCDLPKRWILAINVAPRSLESIAAAEEIVSIVAESTLDVKVVLEITERQLLKSDAITQRAIGYLRSAGILLAADDFGTENSNIDLFSRFKFDFLKIDRHFIENVDAEGKPLVQGILLLAQHLDAVVIAEGVETESQAEALRHIGVPFAQGYYYQRPMTFESLRGLMNQSALFCGRELELQRG